ncbi:MAG: transcriptional regulator [Sphingobacteriaceae bacterium]|nr:transcriptional regulator [Sphingobacteriaceae bacterium]
MDFLDELGELALATRLKRLSDRLANDVSLIYKEAGLELEPKWFLILMLLKKEKLLSIGEISEMLKLSHPAIVQFVDELLKQGLVITSKDSKDARRRMISLSPKGKDVLLKAEPVLEIVKTENQNWLNEQNYNLLNLIVQLEQSLDEKSMYERIQSKLSS